MSTREELQEALFCKEVTAITEEVNKLCEAKRRILKEKAEPAFRRMFDQYFEAHPTVTAVRFTAYTPYFNDGETCEFGVNSVTLQTNEVVMKPKYVKKPRPKKGNWDSGYDWVEEGEEPVPQDEWLDEYTSKPASAKFQMPQLQRALEQLQDMIEEVYGDHNQFTITREGIEVEDYQHE